MIHLIRFRSILNCLLVGGSIERGRGRGRGLYHGSAGYTRSTSLYDEEGRRTNLWLDRNGTETAEWAGSGSAVSPRKEYSRGAGGMENWRKGTRDESGGGAGDVDWRSSNNGTNVGREKWGEIKSYLWLPCFLILQFFSPKHKLA